jgi:hypothetical protein
MNYSSNGQEYLDSMELAERFNVSEATLSRMRQDKSGPAYFMVGKQARYRPQSVNAWILAQERATGAA